MLITLPKKFATGTSTFNGVCTFSSIPVQLPSQRTPCTVTRWLKVELWNPSHSSDLLSYCQVISISLKNTTPMNNPDRWSLVVMHIFFGGPHTYPKMGCLDSLQFMRKYRISRTTWLPYCTWYMLGWTLSRVMWSWVSIYLNVSS